MKQAYLVFWIVTASMLVSFCAGTVSAQPQQQPSPSGLYEAYSPLHMAPVGPITQVPNKLLPQWLEVKTTNDTSVVTFQPKGTITWQLKYGPHGLVSKTTRVHDELWTTSHFTYTPQGHLLRKEVDGPGAHGGMSFRYQVDAQGRVVLREGKLPERASDKASQTSRWTVKYTQNRATVEHALDGKVRRRDTFDSHGLPLALEVAPDIGLGLNYTRNAKGKLLAIKRRRGKNVAKVEFHRPQGEVLGVWLDQLAPLFERSEILMLLGAPITHSEDSKGAKRTSTDNYHEACEVNATSTLQYDAADLLIGKFAACICGFCVAAESNPQGIGDLEGRDSHWTRGPWIRINGLLELTHAHEIMTPTGPRQANALQVGDRVLAAEGGEQIVHSIERIPTAQRRLGVNLRTQSKRFHAKGFVLVSEPPCIDEP